MKELFNLDLKNYDPNGKVFSRPSARAIIYKDGKLLLVHSEKYDYYKFPGGGIEPGEPKETALVREVREETGYRVIPSSIEEYGSVMRRQKSDHEDEEIFEQENFYYFCDVEDTPGDVKLDDYEAEEGFAPAWIAPVEAARHNMYESRAEGKDISIVKRDAKVMDMADIEIRKRERAKREAAAIKALGDLDYQGMLDFVEDKLKEDEEYAGSGKSEIDYSRFEHTKRVLAWAKRLYDLSECKDKIRYEDLMTATIFHDVGRALAVRTGESHAHAGVPYTREYLIGHGFDAERTEYICSLVASHSDKYRMAEPDLDPALLMLMEADLMDDAGALGIVMDCMITEGRNPQAHFTDAYDHIVRFTKRLQNPNPMRTADARRIWDSKTKLVNEFTDALLEDIEL